jgi:hypothetical protein
MTATWQDYQAEAASFFRSLGLDAATDVRLVGVRTNHDIDVVVKMHHVGFDVTWLVECKHWRNPVSKLHVLSLRSIVSELGVDRGILLCETGFQSGAIEAATLTNVQVTSLEQLRNSAANEIIAMRLRELFDRVEVCKSRYGIFQSISESSMVYVMMWGHGSWVTPAREVWKFAKNC